MSKSKPESKPRRGTAALVTGALVALTSTACGAVAKPHSAPNTGTPSTGTPSTGTPSAALPFPPQSYVRDLVAQAPVPPGAERWTRSLRSSPAALDNVYYFPVSGFMSDEISEASRAYVTTEGPSLVRSYVTGHIPKGGRLTTTGTAPRPYGQSGLELSVPGPEDGGYSGTIEYTITPRDQGNYFLRIDASAYWDGQRLAVEHLSSRLTGSLTVFKRLSLASPSSGPVKVPLSGRAEAKLLGALNSLPVMPLQMCMETDLLYTLSLHPVGRQRPVYQVSGWGCDQNVLMTVNGTSLPPLRDPSCSVLSLVTALAPATATGTRGATADCPQQKGR
jgi:hypothetical protein